MKKKKTAIELMIQHFKRLERVAKGIDDEQAYHYRMAINIAELYLRNEEKQIAKAYTEGIGDMAIGKFWNNGHQYYLETYGY
jgi:predicted transcriptional regulator